MYIKEIRKQNNMKSKELAHLLGLSNSGYCGKEKGNRKFTAKEIAILCELFNIKIEQIEDLK